MRILTLRKLTPLLLVILILIPSGVALTLALDPEETLLPQVEAPASTAASNPIYLPLVTTLYIGAEITDAWIGNQDGIALSTFLPGAPVEYIVSGINHLSQDTTVDFSWTLVGPCGFEQIVTKSLDLKPGLWVEVTPTAAPSCLGLYTATAQITGPDFTSVKTVSFRVNTSSVVISENQGFDRCNIPTIAEMQTWWDSSPYYVANVYLGGISYDNTTGCSNDNVDANWMQSVADQGWTFLLTWVGPQAPCSGYKYRMSYDSALSYQQGRDEAEAALQAAADIGLASSIILHYDVEGYGNATNWACRSAVDSFLQGWTARLHELGAQSGAYGSPCNSHISDWADNVSPPDDVWIAHWVSQDYDPFATVWDVTCLSNDLWPNYQRARQYAGDHTETWGGLPLRIDSNVHEGKVVSLAVTDTLSTTFASNLDAVLPQPAPHWRDLGLLSPDHGWLFSDERLLITQDGGLNWADHTPQEITAILDAHFLDAANGFLLHRSAQGLGLLITADGGVSWQAVSMPLPDTQVAAGFLAFTSAQSGTLTLKLPTGSSFNQARQYTTQDGGQTWQGGQIRSVEIEENLPGLLSSDPNLPDGTIDLYRVDRETAWALTQQGNCQGSKTPVGAKAPPDALPWQCQLQTRLWNTADGGQTWHDITPE